MQQQTYSREAEGKIAPNVQYIVTDKSPTTSLQRACQRANVQPYAASNGVQRYSFCLIPPFYYILFFKFFLGSILVYFSLVSKVKYTAYLEWLLTQQK
jgi:hypothetical protein